MSSDWGLLVLPVSFAVGAKGNPWVPRGQVIGTLLVEHLELFSWLTSGLGCLRHMHLQLRTRAAAVNCVVREVVWGH